MQYSEKIIETLPNNLYLCDIIPLFLSIFGCHLSAMVMVHFSFLGRSQDVNLQCTSDSLLSNMSRALCIGPEDLSCVQCQEDASCWFNITVQMPDKKELLDTLRYQAIGKAKWLQNCAVKAVRIGDEAQILLQPITSSTFMMTDSSTGEKKKLQFLMAPRFLAHGRGRVLRIHLGS